MPKSHPLALLCFVRESEEGIRLETNNSQVCLRLPSVMDLAKSLFKLYMVVQCDKYAMYGGVAVM